MKTIFDHITYIKGKPHHVRKQVAFGVATGVSAFVALAWFVGSYASGAFAIQGNSFAMAADQTSTVATTSSSGDQGLAGVDAAAALQDQSAPAHIDVVDTGSDSQATTSPSDQTTLPF